MLNEQDMLSVNQTAAQIKLMEAWKAANCEDYPIKLMTERVENGDDQRILRSNPTRRMNEGGKTRIARSSFTRDTGRVWNQAPRNIKEAGTLGLAKKLIRDYCKTLPV